MQSFQRKNVQHVEMNAIARQAIAGTNQHAVGNHVVEDDIEKDTFGTRLRNAYREASSILTKSNTLQVQIYGESDELIDDEEDEEARAKFNAYWSEIYSYWHSIIFPGMPEHYPLKKKLLMVKAASSFGTAWDVGQIVLSIAACGMYVAELEVPDYETTRIYGLIEIIGILYPLSPLSLRILLSFVSHSPMHQPHQSLFESNKTCALCIHVFTSSPPFFLLSP